MEEIRWTGPAFEQHDKGFFWETGIIIGAAILVVIAIFWQKNFLFAVFIAIAALMIIFWGRQAAPDVEFVIDEKGIEIGKGNRYYFEELSEFSISPNEIAHDGMAELIFHKKSAFGMHVNIPAPLGDVGRIRKLLGNFMPEFEYESSLIDHVSRWFKF